jgi:hypothetical protein
MTTLYAIAQNENKIVVTAIHEADTDIAYICSQGNVEGEKLNTLTRDKL